MIFEVARVGDLEAFRRLYLSGSEARQLFGDEAAAYLDRRKQHWLEDELLEISVRVAPPARFDGARIDADGNTALRVISAAVGAYELPAGRAIQVGRIWRLREPVGDWTPFRQVGAPPGAVRT